MVPYNLGHSTESNWSKQHVTLRFMISLLFSKYVFKLTQPWYVIILLIAEIANESAIPSSIVFAPHVVLSVGLIIYRINGKLSLHRRVNLPIAMAHIQQVIMAA